MKAGFCFSFVMFKSLFEEIPALFKDEEGKPESGAESPVPNDSEKAFLNALPVVQKIVRRKILFSSPSDASDLVQLIALRLWKWREKYREKSVKMSTDEWQSLAARTAYNEINRLFSNNSKVSNVALEEVSEVAAAEFVEGQTEAEFYSLARVVWQEICRLTLRQRRALLVSSWELVFYLLKSGVNDDEMIEILKFNMEVWEKIKAELPLSDARLAEIIRETDKTKNPESLTKSIKKARHEARGKLQKLRNK